MEISCSTQEDILLGDKSDRTEAIRAWMSPSDVVSLNLIEEGAVTLGAALLGRVDAGLAAGVDVRVGLEDTLADGAGREKEQQRGDAELGEGNAKRHRRGRTRGVPKLSTVRRRSHASATPASVNTAASTSEAAQLTAPSIGVGRPAGVAWGWGES